MAAPPTADGSGTRRPGPRPMSGEDLANHRPQKKSTSGSSTNADTPWETTRKGNAPAPVYIGQGFTGETVDGYGFSPRPMTVDSDYAIDSYNTLPSSVKDALTAAAKSEHPSGSGRMLWENLVKTSVYQNETYGRQVSPFDLLRNAYGISANVGGVTGVSDQWRRTADAMGAGASSGGGGSYGTTTSVSLTTPQQARALADQALMAYLGRAAKPEERSAFLSALNEAERNNPVTVTMSGSSRTQSGGLDAQQFAAEWAQEQEGSGEYQAATKYMDYFIRAVGG